MKSLSIVGIILLTVSLILFYFNTDSFSVNSLQTSHFTGIMGGIGIGLFIGGLVGYLSKGEAIRAEARRKEVDRLKQEKEQLEKQVQTTTPPAGMYDSSSRQSV